MTDNFSTRSKKQIRLSLNDCLVERLGELKSAPVRFTNLWMLDVGASLTHLIEEEEEFLATLWDLQAELVAIEEEVK